MLALVEAVFILGVEGRTAPDHLKDSAQAFVILDQQRAGGRTDEYLDAGAAGCAFELRQISYVLARAADEKREVAMHPMPGAFHLIGEGLLVNGEWIGVGHLEYGRHPTHHG